MQRILILSLVFLFSFPAVAQAQDASLRDGFIDLVEIENWFDQTPKLEVNIDGPLLEFLQETVRESDEDAHRILGRIDFVQVRGFDLEAGDPQRIGERTDRLAQMLEETGWHLTARVREDDENVSVFTRIAERKMKGLVVMIVSDDEDEAVFVNIAGDIEPGDLSTVGRTLDIEVLEDVGR